MNKTFCDICSKEIQQRDSWHFKLEARNPNLGTDDNRDMIQLHEICKDCVNKIKGVIGK
jgi:hypothetical protein